MMTKHDALDTTAHEGSVGKANRSRTARNSWRRIGPIIGGLGLIAAVGVGAYIDSRGGDNVTPMTTSFTFPECDGHKPMPPIDMTLPKGMTFETGPHGSDKKIAVTVGDAGQLTFAKVTGAEQTPPYDGQSPNTANFVFSDNERLSIFTQPADRNRTVIHETQIC